VANTPIDTQRTCPDITRTTNGTWCCDRCNCLDPNDAEPCSPASGHTHQTICPDITSTTNGTWCCVGCNCLDPNDAQPCSAEPATGPTQCEDSEIFRYICPVSCAGLHNYTAEDYLVDNVALSTCSDDCPQGGANLLPGQLYLTVLCPESCTFQATPNTGTGCPSPPPPPPASPPVGLVDHDDALADAFAGFDPPLARAQMWQTRQSTPKERAQTLQEQQMARGAATAAIASTPMTLSHALPRLATHTRQYAQI